MQNISSFIDLLLDYYLKLTLDQSKKHLSDEFFKQIQERQCSFLQLIVFVIPYDRKQRLTSQFHPILQNIRRQIDKNDLNYFRYQMQIISHLLSTRNLSEISQDFYHSIMKKLLDEPIECDLQIWINSMKELFVLFFHQPPDQESFDQFPMKFLRSLTELIQWPLDDQSKVMDISWRMIFIRLLASINAMLTHRVEQFECRTLSTMRKISKEKLDSINPIDEENPLVPSSMSHNEDYDEMIEHEETPSNKQIQSDLSHLEQELLQVNSLFSTVEKWIETVSVFLLTEKEKEEFFHLF